MTTNGPSPAARPTMRWRIGPRRWLAAAALVGVAFGASVGTVRALLPREGAVAKGVRVAGVTVPEGAPAQATAEAAAEALLERRFTFTWKDERLLEASLAELGATVDVGAIATKIASIGHDGGLIQRIDASLEARRGHIDLPVRVTIPIEPLAERLARI